MNRSYRRTCRTTACALALLLPLTFNAYGATMNKPDVKLNPTPRMRYEITLKVEDAPGPFDRIEGSVDYAVTNTACVPATPITGATLVPEKRVPLVLKKEGDNVYKGELFVDLLQDEDYYGMGVCHWAVVAASANLFVKDVDFNAPIFEKDILKSASVTRYYSNRSYATTQVKRLDGGETDRAQYKEEATATFSITMAAKEHIQ